MKLLFLFMFSAIPFLSSAQGKIRYSYDWSGNRIERVIVMPKAKSNAAARHDSFTDDFGDTFVLVLQNYMVMIAVIWQYIRQLGNWLLRK